MLCETNRKSTGYFPLKGENMEKHPFTIISVMDSLHLDTNICHITRSQTNCGIWPHGKLVEAEAVI